MYGRFFRLSIGLYSPTLGWAGDSGGRRYSYVDFHAAEQAAETWNNVGMGADWTVGVYGMY